MKGFKDSTKTVRMNMGGSCYAKGGSVSAKSSKAPSGKVSQAKVGKVMREYGKGELHSGSAKGPVVKNQKQAVAIALSEGRKAAAGKKSGGTPKPVKKANGGPIGSPLAVNPTNASPATGALPQQLPGTPQQPMTQSALMASMGQQLQQPGMYPVQLPGTPSQPQVIPPVGMPQQPGMYPVQVMPQQGMGGQQPQDIYQRAAQVASLMAPQPQVIPKVGMPQTPVAPTMAPLTEREPPKPGTPNTAVAPTRAPLIEWAPPKPGTPQTPVAPTMAPQPKLNSMYPVRRAEGGMMELPTDPDYSDEGVMRQAAPARTRGVELSKMRVYAEPSKPAPRTPLDRRLSEKPRAAPKGGFNAAPLIESIINAFSDHGADLGNYAGSMLKNRSGLRKGGKVGNGKKGC